MTVTVETALTDMEDIADYLAAATANPVPLAVKITLDPAGWQALLAAIDHAGKSVALDLSACTGVTEFDPDSSISTGKNKIVSLVLPGTAERIPAGTIYYTTFVYFAHLAEVSGTGITDISFSGFRNWDPLTSVTFPAATHIGNDAFWDCGALPR